MVVNLKLVDRWPFDPRGRDWTGWEENASEEELWDRNRGYHRLGDRVLEERFATLSYGGVIRVVAEITGRTPIDVPDKRDTYWALEGHVLPAGHPMRDALVGSLAPPGRATVRYIPDPEVGAQTAFLMTWNPDRWTWQEEELVEAIDATADGRTVEQRWATGTRTSGIEEGDRAFLLKQGAEPRGIVAGGVIRGPVLQAEHWDGSSDVRTLPSAQNCRARKL